MLNARIDRAERDALARELFVNVMKDGTGLGDLSIEDQEVLYDRVSEVVLRMANRFLDRAFNTPTGA